jgi:hypothetical protein
MVQDLDRGVAGNSDVKSSDAAKGEQWAHLHHSAAFHHESASHHHRQAAILSRRGDGVESDRHAQEAERHGVAASEYGHEVQRRRGSRHGHGQSGESAERVDSGGPSDGHLDRTQYSDSDRSGYRL